MTALILASTSPTRLAMVAAAGLETKAVAPPVDEDVIKRRLRAERASPERVAAALAEAKALAVSDQHPHGLVIGADQMLVCDGVCFDKPADRVAARDQLQSLRGRTHQLISAVAVASGGQSQWRTVATATMTMRPLTDGFLDRYLDRIGPAAFSSVGAYQLEGLGAQLFDRIEGDHFTILGLPLLPLLAYLRSQGAVDD
jgi:septum formation protein